MRTYLQFPQITFKHSDAATMREVVGNLGPKNYDDLLGRTGIDAPFGSLIGTHSFPSTHLALRRQSILPTCPGSASAVAPIRGSAKRSGSITVVE